MAIPKNQKNSKYWDLRSKAEKAWITQNIQNDEEFNVRLKGYYDRAILNINRTIESELSRLAIKENIDINELKQRVKDFDVQEYSIEAKRIVEEADKLRKQGRNVTYEDFSKEINERLRLYNATMRINRQELLKSLIGLNLIELGANIDANLRQKLTKDYTDEITRQAGILGEFKHPIWTGKEVAKIIMAQTGSANFSKRIWANQDALKARLDATLSIGLIQGQNPRKMAKQLRDLVSKEVTNARYATERIARTESARVQTQAQLKSFRDNGYKFCKWHAEPSACKICKEIAENDSGYGVGVYRVDEVPSLPAHPNCRCGLGAYWVDEKSNLYKETIKKNLVSGLERKKNKSKRITINKERQRKLTAGFRKNGGKIWQDAGAEAYLKVRGVNAVALSEDLIALKNRPTISEILEELYHVEQFKDGKIDVTNISRYKAEIEAQNYLLSVKKLYNIPEEEILETKANLQYWKEKLENERNKNH
ncbi:minor capsid protein [Ligilactobacillus salivarius]|uniref:minor capsid protein n=1 Tax=Ligilactobacillus salivarius TaxID=1624 RepID=UPI001E63808A|nr:minor capsid protein [Ligilactobacillus salivarius]